MNEVPWTNASTIGSEAAHETWALAARMLLEETARSYHAVTSAAEVADYAQQRSRIRTGQAYRYWIGDVLFRVMQHCAERGEPLLGALVVDGHGRVGSGYQVAVEELRRETVTGDLDDHAARERLDCYRWFGADLPEGGGEPGPLPAAPVKVIRQTGTTRRTPTEPRAPRTATTAGSRRTAKVEEPPKLCSRCYIALPASGICDFCD